MTAQAEHRRAEVDNQRQRARNRLVRVAPHGRHHLIGDQASHPQHCHPARHAGESRTCTSVPPCPVHRFVNLRIPTLGNVRAAMVRCGARYTMG